jgi:A/G-specific adenine glycosylase
MKPPESFTAAQRRRVQTRLLAWFDQHRRELPWRKNRDAYRIWVSEVMLQQTTVKAVMPLFNQFMALFPTVQDLAKATEQQVLHAWQGLGYYRRARWLHQAAQHIVNEFDRVMPMTAEAWDTLPGIGRYTRNAILSQAFDQRLPIVEANSLRVMSRWFASRYDPKSGEGVAWLWDAAETMMPKSRCGDWNQALMELGALVCTVKEPRCDVCPVRTVCHAHKQGVQHELPVLAKRAEKIVEQEVGLLVRSLAGVLLVQLPPTARRWGTMWTIPTAPVEGDEAVAGRTLANQLGLKKPKLLPHSKLAYIVTRHRITLTVYAVDVYSKVLDLSSWADHRWVTLADVAEYPMSTHQRRLFS